LGCVAYWAVRYIDVTGLPACIVWRAAHAIVKSCLNSVVLAAAIHRVYLDADCIDLSIVFLLPAVLAMLQCARLFGYVQCFFLQAVVLCACSV
jgi:hypothetical protein